MKFILTPRQQALALARQRSQGAVYPPRIPQALCRGRGLRKDHPLLQFSPCTRSDSARGCGRVSDSALLFSSAPAMAGSVHGQGPGLLIPESTTAGASRGLRAVLVRTVTSLLPTPHPEHPIPLGTGSVLLPAASPFHTQVRKRLTSPLASPSLPTPQIFWPEPWETCPGCLCALLGNTQINHFRVSHFRPNS